MPQLAEIVSRFLNNPTLYHPCLLLVHSSMERLDTLANDLAAQYHWPLLNISHELSAALLGVAEIRRPTSVASMFGQILRRQPADVLLCASIDLLFEPSLQLDPVQLLRQGSRQRRLIVLWPGSFVEGTLAYATREHAHYRIWSTPGLHEGLIYPV
jgi:hypothetical protein